MQKDKKKKPLRRSNRRSAEILAVFTKHNFYSGGFTPEELRTTLEDLGPTYVKIGQIMSSAPTSSPRPIAGSLKSSAAMSSPSKLRRRVP